MGILFQGNGVLKSDFKLMRKKFQGGFHTIDFIPERLPIVKGLKNPGKYCEYLQLELVLKLPVPSLFHLV